MTSSNVPDFAVKTFLKGQIIYREGDPASYIYLIKKGKILLVKDQFKILPMNLLKEKELLGEVALFNEGNYETTAIALEESQLMEIDFKYMQETLGDLPEWFQKLMENLSNKINLGLEVMAENQLSNEEDTDLTTLMAQEGDQIRGLVRNAFSS